jgi:hypothetical protein
VLLHGSEEEEETDSEDDSELKTVLGLVEEPTEADWDCVLNPGLTERDQECVRSMNDRLELKDLLENKETNDVWWCTDLATLKAMVIQERTEQIGLACCRYLEV